MSGNPLATNRCSDLAPAGVAQTPASPAGLVYGERPADCGAGSGTSGLRAALYGAVGAVRVPRAQQQLPSRNTVRLEPRSATRREATPAPTPRSLTGISLLVRGVQWSSSQGHGRRPAAMIMRRSWSVDRVMIVVSVPSTALSAGAGHRNGEHDVPGALVRSRLFVLTAAITAMCRCAGPRATTEGWH